MDDFVRFTRTWHVSASKGYDTAWGEFEGDRLHARGRALALEGGPYWVGYRLETGPRFVTRSLHVSVEGPGHAKRELVLCRDDDGRWTVDGQARAEFDGALDCDLGLCPLTNTMPVRRHGLHLAGEQAPEQQFLMAWVAVPELTVTPSTQTYTPLGGHRVRYSSEGFRSDVEFDSTGLVLDYPGLATAHLGDDGTYRDNGS
ncbi:putative glycolipid-binding domain-containing protein [Streptomyces katrae]|uniref:putative glycolipid-binding domain-containing protein n=1 Tax=Streptomyces katrae TaxID=68223 RepID=UPI00068AD7C2|nr:putative glycolipid-binding domain-containing protein [Streptomyces katrae]